MRSRSLRRLAPSEELPAYILAALARVGLSRRIYQELGALRTLALLRAGSNVEVNLPPGTGKTLLAQIVAAMWIKEHSPATAKVLCLLPTSHLRQQHFSYAVWWAGEGGLCKPLELTPEWLARKRVWHQKVFEEKDLWFALPELAANAIQRALLPAGLLTAVSLVILDEYDSFSVGVLRAEGERLRFTKHWSRLLEMLEWNRPRYLFMSATPARHTGHDE